jgi:hypothetical protein
MERFYHIRARKEGRGPVLNNGGATVHLESIADDPLHLRMRVAYCNPVDVFCKEEGRQRCTGRDQVSKEVANPGGPQTVVVKEACAPKAQRTIAIRNLPSELGRVYKAVHRRMKQPIYLGDGPNYEGRLREWLPRD